MNNDSLKTPEALEKYCQKRLGDWKLHGREKRFRCPFGNHTKLHLAIGVANGIGVWKCRSCDTGGDIFKLAGLLNGMDIKTEFPDILQDVSETLGIPLDDSPHTRREKTRKRPFRSIMPQPATPPPAVTPVYVGEADNMALEVCRLRIINDYDLRVELAAELGIRETELLARASFIDPYYGGLVGATEDRRLLYLYSIGEYPGTRTPRYTGAKLRRRALPHQNPFLKLVNGQWQSYGTMNPTTNNKDGVRFLWPIGKAFQPWGMIAAMEKAVIVITEGESDAIAMSCAMEDFRICYQQDQDPETGLPYEDTEGSLEATIPAVVAIPGAKNFPKEWKHYFTNKLVIICMDADKAGQEGCRRLMDILKSVNCTIVVWTPPAPYKDARDMLRDTRTGRLCRSLLKSVSLANMEKQSSLDHERTS